MIKKIQSIFKWILIVFLGIILLINVMSFLSLHVFHNHYSNLFGYTYFVVATGSMQESIREQDIVIVKITKDIEIGDVITYRSGDTFITHRVTSINKDVVVTKGDANNTVDKPIKKEQVVGKVVKTLSGVGIILSVITDKVVILLVLLFIIIISYLSSLKNEEGLKCLTKEGSEKK